MKIRKILVRLSLASTLLASLAFTSAIAAFLPQPQGAEFDYGAKLTVAGYSGSSPLAGFPVLVRIAAGSPSGFSYDDLHSKSDGSDIAFVDMEGNGLPFEIDTWNTSGTSLIWVRLPSMTNGTEFVMCWGSDTSGKTICGTNPFSDYKGVWHMNTASPVDASASGNDGTAAGSASVAGGKIGSALSVPDSNSYVTCGEHQSNAELKDAFTVEAWANSDDQNGNHCIFGKNLFISLRSNGNNQLQVTTPGKKDHNMSVATLPAKGTWWHVALTFQKGATNGCKVYVNGSLAAQTDAGDISDQTNATEMWLGKNQWGQNFKGMLDEIRLSVGIKSAEWIAATCAAQGDEDFLTIGAAEPLRDFPDPAGSIVVGSAQISNAVVTVSVSRLGADASYADVTVAVSTSSDFSSTTWTETYRVTGEDARGLSVAVLDPATTYYARAIVENNKGKSATTSVVSFRTKKAPHSSTDKIIPGLEDYGALTLVDEIDCANDTEHRFREYPAGVSSVQTILDVDTRVMFHQANTCCYVSWRVGEGKGIVPNDPYVLVVDYPDDAPRSVTVFNFGNATRHGYHTGWTAGDSWSPPYVTQSLESWPVPYSGETKQLVQVMVPFEKSKQYNGSDTRIQMDTDGFDLNFGLIKAAEAPDSVGLAISAIRLYKIDSYDVARPSIPYPAEGLPRRIVTSREEMGDGDDFAGFAHPQDFYKGRAKMIRLLGMNTCSKDLLEFGYQQNFPGNSRWGYATDYWTEIVDNLAEEDIYILPFYEYHGSRGASGIGYMDSIKPWTLNSAKDASYKYLFSNQSYVYNCMVDMTNDEALWDLQKLFQVTIQPYIGKANFLGMWIRNRGAMPMCFNDGAIGRFNSDTGRSITRADIYNNGNYRGTDLYNAYREWWYGKRCSIFTRLQGLINGQLPGAKVYYSNTIEEPGEFWANWGNPKTVMLGTAADQKYQGKDFNEYTGKNWRTSVGWTADDYWSQALNADCPTWGNYEIHHSAPADDPHNYTNLSHVALCYPFNCVWTVAGSHGWRYRNASGDLPFVRHYSLNENDFKNESGSEICGYYTCDWDHAGRAVMVAELYAMAYNDPTMLAYLFTANLVRNDSTYVREFNLNYLSLPALKGEALVGGSWPATLTVRRWATNKGTYWAVINCDVHEWSGTVDFQTDKTEIWYTVSGQRLALSGGKATLHLEPFQMVCFTDVEPEHVDSPVFRYAFAEDVEAKAATLTVTLSELGYGATSAAVAWSLSGGAAAESSGTLPTYTTHGTQTVRLTGLEPETEYVVTLLATNSAGRAATMDFTFKTALWPYVFQDPIAVTDSGGTNATVSVKLSRADFAGTLSLFVGDNRVKTWNSIAADIVYTGSFGISLGKATRYRFVVDPGGGYETEATGRVMGRKTIGWLDIQLDKSNYASWPFAAASGVDPVDGGTWTKSGENNISTWTSEGGNKRIALATEEDGFVRYVTKTPSHEGKKVRIEGRTQFAVEYGEPAALDTAPLAALALGREGTVRTLYGYSASGWVPFPAFRVPSDGWIDWAADLDFDAKTVTYSAGDPLSVLASAGTNALPIAGTARQVSRVTYIGSGAIDDFKGVYYIETNASQTVVSDTVVVRTDGTGLTFSNVGTDIENFVIGLKDAEAGGWYAAFGCTALSSDHDDWLCVSCVRASGSAVDLPVSTEDRPTQFFMLFRVSGEIDPGTPLSDLLKDE